MLTFLASIGAVFLAFLTATGRLALFAGTSFGDGVFPALLPAIA